MVYCSRCGTLNSDSVTNCTNCGAPIYSGENRFYSRYERRKYYQEGYGYRRKGSGLGLIILGVFVLLFGLAAFFNFWVIWNYFWAILLVFFGLWLLFWGLRHNRPYSRQPPPP